MKMLTKFYVKLMDEERKCDKLISW